MLLVQAREPACHEVFNIVELREKILGHVPTIDLILHARLACKAFNESWESNIKLCQGLILAPRKFLGDFFEDAFIDVTDKTDAEIASTNLTFISGRAPKTAFSRRAPCRDVFMPIAPNSILFTAINPLWEIEAEFWLRPELEDKRFATSSSCMCMFVTQPPVKSVTLCGHNIDRYPSIIVTNGKGVTMRDLWSAATARGWRLRRFWTEPDAEVVGQITAATVRMLPDYVIDTAVAKGVVKGDLFNDLLFKCAPARKRIVSYLSADDRHALNHVWSQEDHIA